MIESETPKVSAVAQANNEVRLPMGILGFEQIKDYVLLVNPEEEPFAWLQVKANASLAFVVVDPFLVMPNYQPDIPEADVEFLGLRNTSDALLLNIVTIHGPHRATINLKGPIVINRHTHIGKQIIIANAVDYSVQHPLPVAGSIE
ncbi:MAG TPA: flagellar assembly protein FliW [Candidatus Sulfopaludibacter sp.]|nr:flagellar assembly protein FliW [Candidatus Sulfopaludibacter sp.]